MQDGDELLVITQQGMILRMPTDDVRAIGRATQGVTLIDIEGDDKVVSIARLVEKEDESGDEPPTAGGDRTSTGCCALPTAPSADRRAQFARSDCALAERSASSRRRAARRRPASTSSTRRWRPPHRRVDRAPTTATAA